MKHFIYKLLQWTWGLFQTFIGAIVYLTQHKNPQYGCQGAVVTNWRGHGGSLSLGMFLFLDIAHSRPETEIEKRLLAHEYGHTIQSLILGPLYLPIIGLPSLIWAACFRRYRVQKHRSYNFFYTEKWADKLGARFCR